MNSLHFQFPSLKLFSSSFYGFKRDLGWSSPPPLDTCFKLRRCSIMKSESELHKINQENFILLLQETLLKKSSNPGPTRLKNQSFTCNFLQAGATFSQNMKKRCWRETCTLYLVPVPSTRLCHMYTIAAPIHMTTALALASLMDASNPFSLKIQSFTLCCHCWQYTFTQSKTFKPELYISHPGIF